MSSFTIYSYETGSLKWMFSKISTKLCRQSGCFQIRPLYLTHSCISRKYSCKSQHNKCYRFLTFVRFARSFPLTALSVQLCYNWSRREFLLLYLVILNRTFEHRTDIVSYNKSRPPFNILSYIQYQGKNIFLNRNSSPFRDLHIRHQQERLPDLILSRLVKYKDIINL